MSENARSETDLDAYFAGLNSMELLMREYYIASKDAETLREFLSRPGLAEAGCYIPGVTDPYEVYTEQNMFPEKNRNITVSRHLRYTPEFTHTHTLFEVVYVLKGKCRNVVRDTVQELYAGDFCIITPNIPHVIGVFDDSLVFNILIKKSTFNETFFKLLSTDNLLTEFFTCIIYNKKAADYLLFHTAEDSYFERLARSLIRESLQEDHYTELCQENLLMLMFSRLLRFHQENAEIPAFRSGKQSILVTNIIKYIYAGENYKTVTLTELSRIFNYSTQYISRIISHATGQSFLQIVTKIKLNKSLALLESTDMTVNDIALSVGYENSAYFHRMFQKYMDMTPLSYRAAAAQGRIPEDRLRERKILEE